MCTIFYYNCIQIINLNREFVICISIQISTPGP